MQKSSAVVRGRCACGKRYRIRNARPGITVVCPNCRRLIPVTLTDIRIAETDQCLIPVQHESVELIEAVPINQGPLRLAPKGSRPGLTGARVLSHDEAVLASVQHRNASVFRSYETPESAGAGRPPVWAEFDPSSRTFVEDLFASFYCAGVGRNALHLISSAVACSVILFGALMLTWVPRCEFMVYPVCVLIIVYMVQFFWNVLKMTAADEELIPFAPEGWHIWDDGVSPALYMLGIAAACSLPYALVLWLAPQQFAHNPLPAWIALAVGWFFCPVAVMSVAIGGSLRFIRPDWLIRCVVSVGPVYIVAWIAAMLAVGGWYLFLTYWRSWIWIPGAGVVVNLYCGYVVFRTFGLLYRHFRKRFPWKSDLASAQQTQ